MPPPDYSGLLKLLYDWQTLIAGGLAIIAAIIGAIAAYRVGNAQVAAAKQKDRLQARGIVIGVHPELVQLRVRQQRARKVMAQWSLMQTPTMDTLSLVPAIKEAKIELTPLMLRHLDNFFLVQPGAASLQQVVSFTLQYNGLVDKLADQIAENVNSFDPPAHQEMLSGNLTAIGTALGDAIREIGPIHDEATSQ